MVENTFFDVFIDKKPLDLTSHFGAFQLHSQMDQNAGKKCKIWKFCGTSKNTVKHDGIALGQGEENTYICNVRPDASKKHTKRKH